MVAALWVVAGMSAWMLAAGPATAASRADQRPLVVEAPIVGTIDPVTVEFVDRVLAEADDRDADAVVFAMDTPGGLSTSMDDIIKKFLAERERPVIVYVSPSGGRAASAGAFIVMASDVAAMSPNTNIGSATPIQGSGKDIGGDLRKKVVNDAVTKFRSLARTHGRDEEFADDAVREAENIDEEAALERGVVEFVAEDLEDLLDAADGTTTKPKGLVLDTKDARVEHMGEPAALRLLKVFIDPNILFLLFAAGTIGLAFEITHPGALFPGIVGAICIIIALFGVQVLPINMAGVALLVLALLLFAAEAFVASQGILGAGGAVSLFLGGLLLFDRDSPFAIDIPLLAVVALLFLGFFTLVVRKAVSARRAPVVTGQQWLSGSSGTVRKELDPDGQVFVRGELWRARTIDGSHMAIGEQVEVVGSEGLTLLVSAAAPAAGTASSAPTSPAAAADPPDDSNHPSSTRQRHQENT